MVQCWRWWREQGLQSTRPRHTREADRSVQQCNRRLRYPAGQAGVREKGGLLYNIAVIKYRGGRVTLILQ